MSKKKYVIPEGMLDAAIASVQDGGFDRYRVFLEAALRWLSENPIVPTDNEVTEAGIKATGYVPNQSAKLEGFRKGVLWMIERNRRMFLAPEPEVPENVKDLCSIQFRYDQEKIQTLIVEAFRRGQRNPNA